MCNMEQTSFSLSVTHRLPRGMFNNNDTERVVPRGTALCDLILLWDKYFSLIEI